MDFPLILSGASSQEFVYAYAELKQTIFLLLRQWYGSFMQSAQMGSRVSPHVADSMLLRTGITATISQISGCECQDVQVYGESVQVVVLYRGQVSDFVFSLTSLSS